MATSEAQKAYQKAWRDSRTPEQRQKALAYQKAYDDAHKKENAARKAAWYQANKARIDAKHREWEQANPDKARAIRDRAYAKRKANAQVHTE